MGLTCGSHIVAEPVPSEPTSLKGESKAVPRGQAVADDGRALRDTEAIASRKFPVFATGVALRGPSKSAGGSVGRLAEIGGTIVYTGDWPPSHPRTIVGLDLPGTVRQSARNTCEHRADSAVDTK